MSQLTIYLPDAHEAKLREVAAAAGLSVSRWIAQLVSQHTQSEWPTEVAALAGAWRDLPFHEPSQVADLPRETL